MAPRTRVRGCPRACNLMRLLYSSFTIFIALLVSQENIMAQSSVATPAHIPLTAENMRASMSKLQAELTDKYGQDQAIRIRRGLHQVVEFWREDDGDISVYEDFIRKNFAGDPASLDIMFDRFQRLLEQLDGHMHEIVREFRNQQDLDIGPVRAYDETFGGYDPSAHMLDDFFQNKLAFTVLLNFPLTTLGERINLGPKWTRREWAE